MNSFKSSLVPLNETIVSISLLKSRPISRTYLGWPLWLLHAFVFWLALDPSWIWPGGKHWLELNPMVHLLHISAVPVLLLVHLFLILLCVWFIPIRLAILYQPYHVDSDKEGDSVPCGEATHVCVKTHPHHGRTGIVPLQTSSQPRGIQRNLLKNDTVTSSSMEQQRRRNNNNRLCRIGFEFQQMNWFWNSKTKQFEQPALPWETLSKTDLRNLWKRQDDTEEIMKEMMEEDEETVVRTKEKVTKESMQVTIETKDKTSSASTHLNMTDNSSFSLCQHWMLALFPSSFHRARRDFGRNLLHIQLPSFTQLLAEHCLAPLFVFQCFNMLLWMLDEQWLVGVFNGITMIGLEATVVSQRLQSMTAMRAMTQRPNIPLKVLRKHQMETSEIADERSSTLRQKQSVIKRCIWMSLPHTELLPGDIVQLPENVSAPADVLLLEGSAVVNEAMLTGESTPQLKTALSIRRNVNQCLDLQRDNRHVVSSGTDILRSTRESATTTTTTTTSNDAEVTNHHKHSSPSSNLCAIGLVLATGLRTQQGKLIRTLMHSQANVMGNYREAIGFILSLLIFALLASGYVLKRGLEDPSIDRWKLFLTCIQIIANVVPPELPFELNLAVRSSLSALTSLRIFCTEPHRVPTAGGITACVFDKTGTITTDEMVFVGVEEPMIAKDHQQQKKKQTIVKPWDLIGLQSTTNTTANVTKTCSRFDSIENVLVGCQSLTTLKNQGRNKSSKLVGDAMESSAVNALGWIETAPNHWTRSSSSSSMTTTTTEVKNLQILKRFAFDPERRCMSCIIQSSTLQQREESKDQQRMIKAVQQQRQKQRKMQRESQQRTLITNSSTEDRLFVVKGAPEVLANMLTSQEEANWVLKHASQHAQAGLRVIALAQRHITTTDELTGTRVALEQGLSCVGLALFECPIKADARELIEALSVHSDHSCVMATGDGLETAIAVAEAVGILDGTSSVYCFEPSSKDVTDEKDKNQSKGHWILHGSSTDLNLQESTTLTTTTTTTTVESNKSSDASKVLNPPPHALLAVSAEHLQSVQLSALASQWDPSRLRVWARCAPDQKTLIVAGMQSQGHVVLMAGDGTNDVGGLQKADVGIAVLNAALVLNQTSENENEKPSAENTEGTQGILDMNTPIPLTSAADPQAPLPVRLKLPPLPQQVPGEDAGVWAKAMYKAALQTRERLIRQYNAELAKRLASSSNHPSNQHTEKHPNSPKTFNDLLQEGADEELTVAKLGDASIAAPFTSKSIRLMSVCDVVRLGRCSLVTTLQMYKMLALNCLITAYVMAVLFTDGVRYGQKQMIAVGILATGVTLLLSRGQPVSKLSPQRPIARVFHPYMIITILGQFAIHLLCIARTVELARRGSSETLEDSTSGNTTSGFSLLIEDEERTEFAPSLLNSLMFLMDTTMMISVFLVNYIGEPFKTPLRQNKALAIFVSLLALLVTYIALELNPEFNAEMEMVPLPTVELKHEFVMLMVLNMMGTFVVDRTAKWLLGKRP